MYSKTIMEHFWLPPNIGRLPDADGEQIALCFLDEMNGTVEDARTAFRSDKLTAIAVPNTLDLKK